MIAQPTILARENQANRECLYAWYPEARNATVISSFTDPRDIYVHNGMSKEQPASSSQIAARNPSSETTVDEALRTPWALDYELTRRIPKAASHTTDGIRLVPSSELTEYRLTSVPIAIPEPRTFSKAPTQARTRASSARPNRSGTRPGAMKLSDREVQTLLKQVYGDRVEQAPQYQPVECIHVRAAPLVEQSPPVYVYQRANSWCPDTAAPRALEVSAIPLNPHYLHRPGVIAVKNYEKDALVRGAARPARQPRRGQPVRASTSVPRKSRMSLEMNGVKLTYDPKLTLNDRSAKMTKYSIDGRLYLIKDNRYNILDNISPTVIQHLARPPIPYQAVAVSPASISYSTPLSTATIYS